MKFIFTRTGSLACKTIRSIDDGNWSHCAIGLPTWATPGRAQQCVEAVWHAGVRVRSVDSLLLARPDHLIIEVELPHEKEAVAWLLEQEDALYDWPALPSLAIRRVFGTAPRFAVGTWWYCGELLLAACEAGGYPIKGPLRRYGVQAALDHVLKRARSVTSTTQVA